MVVQFSVLALHIAVRTSTRWCYLAQPEETSSAVPGWVESTLAVLFPFGKMVLYFLMVSVWS